MKMKTTRNTEPVAIAGADGLASLGTSESLLKLDLVDQIRSNGIGAHISLPQLVVCGDQSAGKSSLLTGLTGIPFPRQDGACTKFATEIILRHSSGEFSIWATIRPQSLVENNKQERLQSFKRQVHSLEELPALIQQASDFIGLETSGADSKKRGFSSDVLRLEITGPIGLHLTVVDLPGLIAWDDEGDDETGSDVTLISNLVDSYLQNTRSIILAVIQAGNDVQNQSVIKRARKFDPDGTRTIGVITKPDLINKGTEARVSRLSRNEDPIKFKLGFFIVKNPSPTEMDEMTTSEERNKCEMDFFGSDIWRATGLDMTRVGVEKLRIFLVQLLQQHIERELPDVRKEIEAVLKTVERELSDMGQDRPTAPEQRTFLMRLAMSYHHLTTSALDGTYFGVHGDFFQDLANPSRRFRAAIHESNTRFADIMRTRSKKRLVHDGEESDDEEEQEEEHNRIVMTKSQYTAWVREVYLKTRGRELPGSPNHILISELFRQESILWKNLAHEHLERLCDMTVQFSRDAIAHLVREEHVQRQLSGMVHGNLQEKIEAARQELDRILADETAQPITYNHYFTDTIQKARNASSEDVMRGAISTVISEEFLGKLHISNTPHDLQRFTQSMNRHIVVNMDEQTCAEAITSLDAYYKVAMKTFVDNICRQVAERHLFRGLPDVLGLEAISSLSDEELEKIAAEPASKKKLRGEKRGFAVGLRASLKALQDCKY